MLAQFLNIPKDIWLVRSHDWIRESLCQDSTFPGMLFLIGQCEGIWDSMCQGKVWGGFADVLPGTIDIYWISIFPDCNFLNGLKDDWLPLIPVAVFTNTRFGPYRTKSPITHEYSSPLIREKSRTVFLMTPRNIQMNITLPSVICGIEVR